jgi:hypothetical protein
VVELYKTSVNERFKADGEVGVFSSQFQLGNLKFGIISPPFLVFDKKERPFEKLTVAPSGLRSIPI